MGARSVFTVSVVGLSLAPPLLSLSLHGNDEISISGFELLRITSLLEPSLSQLTFGAPLLTSTTPSSSSSSDSLTVFGLGMNLFRFCVASFVGQVGEDAVGVVDVGDVATICNLLHCGKLVGSK